MWIFEREMSPPPSFQSSFWHQSKQSFVNQEEFFSDPLQSSLHVTLQTLIILIETFKLRESTPHLHQVAAVSLLEIFPDAATEIRCSINRDNLDPYLPAVNPRRALPWDIFICTQWFYLKLIFHGIISISVFRLYFNIPMSRILCDLK